MRKPHSDAAPLMGGALSRRRFVLGSSAATTVAWAGMGPALAKGVATPELSGHDLRLDINHRQVNMTGRERTAVTVNGSLPSPVLRWTEGQRVRVAVTNQLAEDTSIHWHGLILPSAMDGVPHISEGFPGIRPGETFLYEFDLKQSGTYWYHSHSGFQEQLGLYGAIVIEPAAPDPVSYDREHVLVLSDWTDHDPQKIYYKLKKNGEYFNFNQRTTPELLQEIREEGVATTWRKRAMWNQMIMSDRDISDVNGYTYTFLMNGQAPADGWTGLFQPGERVRLRIINAAAMTLFDLRIPGLKMKVVASDGQNIEPVSVDEIRIGVAETYDVVVEPAGDSAYSVFAQAIDRSGYARGTLTPDPSLKAPVPGLDPYPILTHGDMGMAHGSGHEGHDMDGMDHAGHDMSAMRRPSPAMGSGTAGFGSDQPIHHVNSESGPQVDMLAEAPQWRLDDPGVGLRDNGRRVLTYADLRNLGPTHDPRQPDREIQLHLTGNMHRYIWGINGIKFADAEPLRLNFGERVRITLVNDTMMNHPIHLHGMWSELETGDGERIPRKHTVIVQPGSKISYLVTADAMGPWAYHCHLLYHMFGMFREVVVA